MKNDPRIARRASFLRKEFRTAKKVTFAAIFSLQKFCSKYLNLNRSQLYLTCKR